MLKELQVFTLHCIYILALCIFGEGGVALRILSTDIFCEQLSYPRPRSVQTVLHWYEVVHSVVPKINTETSSANKLIIWSKSRYLNFTKKV